LLAATVWPRDAAAEGAALAAFVAGWTPGTNRTAPWRQVAQAFDAESAAAAADDRDDLAARVGALEAAAAAPDDAGHGFWDAAGRWLVGPPARRSSGPWRR
jgi:hypothetical protein